MFLVDNMEVNTGTPLLEMKNMERVHSINNHHTKPKTPTAISPLIRSASDNELFVLINLSKTSYFSPNC